MTEKQFYYVAVSGPLLYTDSTVYGLTSNEVLALSDRFPNSGVRMETSDITYITGHPIVIINALAELGYRVVSSLGEGGNSYPVWTLQKEI